MCLYSKLKDIKKSDCCYYDSMAYSGYEDAIAKPLEFIKDYFHAGSKNEFLYNSLFDFEDYNNKVQKERAIHSVNTFFLGIYFKERIDFLKPHKNSFLAKENNFLWAWFLCSLYHDAFFNNNEDVGVRCDYNRYSNALLYNPDLIKRYYEKEKNPKSSHNDKSNYDHGIIGAEKLYSNYKEMFTYVEKYCSNQTYYGLRIDKTTFKSICQIAKIIACHNVFVAKPKEIEKYKELPELIPENIGLFHYMPNIKNRYSMSSYEKLYFLLALVDTLEPTKREINLKDIDIDVQDNYDGSYILKIDLFNELGDYEKYQNGIMGFKDWLNFIEKSEDGKEITINFNHNKNC